MIRGHRPLARLLGLFVAVVLTAGACTDTYQVAASWDDGELSPNDLEELADAWQASPGLQTAFGLPPATATEGAVSSALATLLLTIRINGEAALRQLDDQGFEMDPSLRQQVAGEVGQVASGFADAQPELDRLIDHLTAIQMVGGLQAAQVYDDIYVSSRYGSFDPESGFVVPPEGPFQPAPSLSF